MQRSDFNYHLPRELIAQHPLPERSASRLLALDGASGEIRHLGFRDLPSLLRADDLLVFNNTRVIPARLWGRKETGGRVEILIERVTGEFEALAHIRSSKSPKPGGRLQLSADADSVPGRLTLEVAGRNDALFALSSEACGVPMAGILRDLGHMPLPPYIERADEAADHERYQTVYGEREGAVAAPTAGLHFTHELLHELDAAGIQRGTVTLHVGAGTFQPVRVDRVEDHPMHAEWVEVGAELVGQVAAARSRGGRVIAVGTTAVRSLEAAAASGALAPLCGDTDIFIYPGYRFRAVDAMVTNFHLPESTLLMLVSAFSGREAILRAYESAIAERYRFFSYGDAMFLTPAEGSR